MYIFVEDKLIHIIEAHKLGKQHGNNFDLLLDTQSDKIVIENLSGHVLIQQVNGAFLKNLFTYFIKRKTIGFESLTLVVKDKKMARQRIVAFYRVIFAAGGVVFNDKNELLLMKRLGKWDLPKGKADAGESSKETAEREVMEECNIKVSVGERICTTWHTYWIKDTPVIKRTKWYNMVCKESGKMKPQLEENIEELRWMNEEQIKGILDNSYTSIRFVLSKVVGSLEKQEV